MKSQIVYIYLHQYFKACKKRFEYAQKKCLIKQMNRAENYFLVEIIS